MLKSFTIYGFSCIVFGLLDSNFFKFMSENGNEPYPMDQVCHINYQLCHAVKFLHDKNLIHTDLKSENILFFNSDFTHVMKNGKMIRKVKNSQIKLIDFGLVRHEKKDDSESITNIIYRAPKVILCKFFLL